MKKRLLNEQQPSILCFSRNPETLKNFEELDTGPKEPRAKVWNKVYLYKTLVWKALYLKLSGVIGSRKRLEKNNRNEMKIMRWSKFMFSHTFDAGFTILKQLIIFDSKKTEHFFS